MNGTCDSVREDLPLFVANALTDARAQQIEAHLSGCVECRRERALIDVLRVRPPAPAGLEARVRGALAAAPARRSLRPALAAAAAVVILAAGAVALQWASGDAPAVATDETNGVDTVELGWAARTDPLLHDAPGLAALSDEELEVLLEEMQS